MVWLERKYKWENEDKYQNEDDDSGDASSQDCEYMAKEHVDKEEEKSSRRKQLRKDLDTIFKSLVKLHPITFHLKANNYSSYHTKKVCFVLFQQLYFISLKS